MRVCHRAELTRAGAAEAAAIAEERNRRMTMTAPATGVVQQLQVHTVGAVLRPAVPLLVIVPDGSTLVVDAMVLNRDAGFVHEGQNVRVKLEAFPFTRYGVVQGRLAFMSRDAVQDERFGDTHAKLTVSITWLRPRFACVSPNLSRAR